MEQLDKDLLLDYEEKPPGPLPEQLKPWTAIIILLVGLLTSVLFGLYLDFRFIAATIVFFILVMVQMYNPRFGFYAVFVVLFFWAFGVLIYLPITIGFFIGETARFNFLPVIVGIIHLFVHGAFRYKDRVPTDTEMTEKATRFQLRVDYFKARFKSRTEEELLAIVKEDRLVPAAVEAARQLLTEAGIDLNESDDQE